MVQRVVLVQKESSLEFQESAFPLLKQAEMDVH